ncbi:hypothetical protein H1191_18990 [Paenactinomyces guangxiensis]|uniref:Amylo-alpha-1,6-glucosidase n=1 Tax=Paenactinomyces guangxiensis TaxID=1490290 RepID=A0A7W2AAM5_9BACL|nr:hypothetical protein [Paenactinomyces guangxiensis]MBH8593613.1 hypothetical protein [Paenactinomyces guangxiensis]
MSYHDGSVWPHVNSIILLGMSKVNRQQEAKVVINGLIAASAHFEYDRLPELFCGYDHATGRPVKYPVACQPQAWAAGTTLVFIQALLGLFPDSLNREIYLSPKLLESVSDLSIGSGRLSLTVARHNNHVDVTIEKNTTGFSVMVR